MKSTITLKGMEFPQAVNGLKKATLADRKNDLTHYESPNAQEQHMQLSIGQINVRFGPYKWRVLDIRNGKALLITQDIIEVKRFHTRKETITWHDCTLKKYLNEEFYDKFTSEQKARIVQVTNKNKRNQWYKTAGGKKSQDNIFLLSIDEVVKYFGDSGQLLHRPYSKQNRVENKKVYSESIKDEYNEKRIAPYQDLRHWWWLRTPGTFGYATVVLPDGSISMIGICVLDIDGGVRPALWLKL